MCLGDAFVYNLSVSNAKIKGISFFVAVFSHSHMLKIFKSIDLK